MSCNKVGTYRPNTCHPCTCSPRSTARMYRTAPILHGREEGLRVKETNRTGNRGFGRRWSMHLRRNFIGGAQENRRITERMPGNIASCAKGPRTFGYPCISYFPQSISLRRGMFPTRTLALKHDRCPWNRVLCLDEDNNCRRRGV